MQCNATRYMAISFNFSQHKHPAVQGSKYAPHGHEHCRSMKPNQSSLLSRLFVDPNKKAKPKAFIQNGYCSCWKKRKVLMCFTQCVNLCHGIFRSVDCVPLDIVKGWKAKYSLERLLGCFVVLITYDDCLIPHWMVDWSMNWHNCTRDKESTLVKMMVMVTLLVWRIMKIHHGVDNHSVLVISLKMMNDTLLCMTWMSWRSVVHFFPEALEETDIAFVLINDVLGMD